MRPDTGPKSSITYLYVTRGERARGEGLRARAQRDVRMAVIGWDTAMIVYPARSLNCN